MKNEVKNCELYCPLKVADMIEKIDESGLLKLERADLIRAITGNISTNISPFDLLRLAGGIPMGNLPNSGNNIITNYDDTISRYGWYNNTSASNSQYAPKNSAGIFFRINVTHAKVTFFFPTVITGEKRLWYRIDGETCIEL